MQVAGTLTSKLRYKDGYLCVGSISLHWSHCVFESESLGAIAICRFRFDARKNRGQVLAGFWR